MGLLAHKLVGWGVVSPLVNSHAPTAAMNSRTARLTGGLLAAPVTKREGEGANRTSSAPHIYGSPGWSPRLTATTTTVARAQQRGAAATELEGDGEKLAVTVRLTVSG